MQDATNLRTQQSCVRNVVQEAVASAKNYAEAIAWAATHAIAVAAAKGAATAEKQLQRATKKQ